MTPNLSLDESRDEAHDRKMTCTDEDEFWEFPEEKVTMSTSPAQHYTTEALLSAVLQWVEVCDESVTGDALALLPRRNRLMQDMHRLGSELKALYDAQEPM